MEYNNLRTQDLDRATTALSGNKDKNKKNEVNSHNLISANHRDQERDINNARTNNMTQESNNLGTITGMMETAIKCNFPMPMGNTQAGEYIRIGNWNIRGANDYTKISQFLEECNDHGYDIVAI